MSRRISHLVIFGFVAVLAIAFFVFSALSDAHDDRIIGSQRIEAEESARLSGVTNLSELPLSDIYKIRSEVFSAPECTQARKDLVAAENKDAETNSEALGGYITCLSTLSQSLRSHGFSEDAKQWSDDLADSYDSLTATLREYPNRARVNEDAITFLERSEPDTGLPSLLTEIKP